MPSTAHRYAPRPGPQPPADDVFAPDTPEVPDAPPGLVRTWAEARPRAGAVASVEAGRLVLRGTSAAASSLAAPVRLSAAEVVRGWAREWLAARAALIESGVAIGACLLVGAFLDWPLLRSVLALLWGTTGPVAGLGILVGGGIGGLEWLWVRGRAEEVGRLLQLRLRALSVTRGGVLLAALALLTSGRFGGYALDGALSGTRPSAWLVAPLASGAALWLARTVVRVLCGLYLPASWRAEGPLVGPVAP